MEKGRIFVTVGDPRRRPDGVIDQRKAKGFSLERLRTMPIFIVRPKKKPPIFANKYYYFFHFGYLFDRLSKFPGFFNSGHFAE